MLWEAENRERAELVRMLNEKSRPEPDNTLILSRRRVLWRGYLWAWGREYEPFNDPLPSEAIGHTQNNVMDLHVTIDLYIHGYT